MTIKDMSLRAMRSMAMLRGSLRRLSCRSASPRCRSSPPSSRPCAGRGAHAGIVYVCVSELQWLARFAAGQRFPHSATLSIAVRPRRGVKPRARKQNNLSNLLLHVVARHSSAAGKKVQPHMEVLHATKKRTRRDVPPTCAGPRTDRRPSRSYS